ncbi:hypothetical protein GCM10027060_18910 [Nesterenkonia halophila]|uniref:hypothetical protein n=1 Tax=Nesterenkonia halophila TaxID=302044 RepID=UPI0012924D47|nr:hypothetical protein [Nesterenkonia halophila]
MSDDTGTPSNSGTAQAEEWHPWWCARGEYCSPNSAGDAIHYSPPRRLVATLPSEGPDGGEDFTAGVAAVAPTEWGEVYDQAACLSIHNVSGIGDIDLHLGVNSLRDFADWLMAMADLIESVHAGQRPDLAELEGAVSNA